jgi:hypothetical protein
MMKTIYSMLAICLVFSGSVLAQGPSENDDAARTSIFVLGGYGYTNRPTQAYVELKKIVSSKDTAKLSEWLHSGDLVMQLYALEGYKSLNIEIEAGARNVISSVLHSGSNVFTANGCVVSHSSVKQVAEEHGYFDLLKK